MPSLIIISVEAPNAPDLAEELAQRLLAKKLANENFPLTSFEHHAILEISTGGNGSADAIDADVDDWIMYKHSTLKKRKLPGKRQAQPPTPKNDAEELVCIEIRR